MSDQPQRCLHCGLIPEGSATARCPSPLNLTRICMPFPKLTGAEPERLHHEIDELRAEVLELRATNAQLSDAADQWRHRYLDLSRRIQSLALQFGDAKEVKPCST